MADDVLAKALAAISRKDRTESEIREWLAVREVEPEEIERVVEYLIENLALDDKRFAIAYASDKRELAGWGRDRIREVLQRRGVERHLIDEALNRTDGESEVDRAVRILIEKRVGLDDDRGRQRALGLLARRGYEAEEAYAAIRIAGRAA
ncbi:MAG: regulatory protein RecX [Solirubrobacterales bacterium]|nr:regulatory protein RecX [Solirubrobacterales bacterium]HMT04957.1 regulatory protein RecX [Solirubrobacterales bacterium]